MGRVSLVRNQMESRGCHNGGRLARLATVAVMLSLLSMLTGATVAQATGTASIKGTVAAAKDGAPLSGITVRAIGEKTEGSAVTDGLGEYTIEKLSEGLYDVEIAASAPYVSFEQTIFVEEGKSEALNVELKQAGELTGKVTSAVTGLGLAGIQVEVRGPEFSEAFAITNAQGEYAVGGLQPGPSTVSFYSSGGLYLNESLSVVIVEGENRRNVALREGGKISGVVTDAYTHAGLGKIGVYAFKATGGSEGSALTNEKGEYTITGLSTGSYTLSYYWEFSEAEYKAFEKAPRAIPKYISQYYSGQPTALTANAVATAEDSVTSGINVAMVPTVPYNTALPVVSGAPTVGTLLTCSTGTWTGESELTATVGWTLSSPFGYQWLRDGGAIAGATTSGYAVQAADLGHGLACEVVATNDAGHASARSASFAVALPVPVITSTASKLAISKNAAKVTISCAKAACSGSIEAVETVLVKHGKKKKERVVVASGTYSLAAGAKGTATLHLTKAGRKRLGQAAHHRLSTRLVISVKGGKPVERTVSLAAGRG